MHFSLKRLKRKLDAVFKNRLGEAIASVCLFPSFKPPRSLSGSQLTLECCRYNLDSTPENFRRRDRRATHHNPFQKWKLLMRSQV
jgi:hypothetical protein